jgi:ubiquinone/menaquinone biosynthesis C-methylase UbiE
MSGSRRAGIGARVSGRLERFPIKGALAVVYVLFPGLGKSLYRLWYHYVSKWDEQGEACFMNFGYAELEPGSPPLPFEPNEDLGRYCLKLYHHVASAVDLKGRTVLEVGCGRGGGSAYIAQCFGPNLMIGMDLVGEAVEFCRRRHRFDNLDFRQGDAENLPFEDGTIDAVVNIESSHLYGSMTRFLAEVYRVLRPGGYLLLADFRDRRQVALLREQFRAAGFISSRETDITRNVSQALDLSHNRRIELVHRWFPRLFRRLGRQFAATRGTSYYEAFRTRRWEYLSFVFQKSSAAEGYGNAGERQHVPTEPDMKPRMNAN